MEKVKWGILSTANFARERFLPGVLLAEKCEVVAIASRDLDKARDMADHFQIPKAYGTYEEILADPEIDLVYVPLPNHLHVDWAIKVLEAGKHVLCEKPLGLNKADAQRLVQASKKYPHLNAMEAFMYRFHPQWMTAHQWVNEGKVGRLCTIQSFFSYNNLDPNNIRNNPDIGGGGLMDIGCYCISLSRWIFGRQANRVLGIVERDPVMKIDRMSSGVMDFGDGTATFTCSTQVSPYQRVHIVGTKGRIEIEIPFNAPPDRETRIWLETHEGIQEK
ncbi:MAG: Gfo/Idh/MocA family oxidoreductase, partial [Verrucomicrobiae bacterium]|nr:Gfo/Idh/MocA family oxidoreductase [Verrucomicrobiae bacterium]